MTSPRLLLTAALLVAATPVFAHITIEQREATVGASAKLVFKVPHGCGNSPTLKLRVRVPDGVIAVKPMVKAGWQIETVTGAYGKTYSYFHGAQLSEGVKEVTWSGKLPDNLYDEFILTGFVSDALKAGTTLYFPVVQECESGVHRWIEIPTKSGQHLEEPAPGVVLVPKK